MIYSTNQPTMNLNSAMMNAFQMKELTDPTELSICVKCFDEAKTLAKKTIRKERKLCMRECGNDKEAMKAFEASIDVSRFVHAKCSYHS